MFDLKLKVARLIFIGEVNTNIEVITDFMEHFDHFEKNKIPDNVLINVDF